MENIQRKAQFLRQEYTPLLQQLSPAAERRWGKMNLHQMIEHMSDTVRIANGRDPHKLMTPEENVPKMQAFLMSDKSFRENTPNALLPADPTPVRQQDINEAIAELQGEIDHLFQVFNDDKDKTIMNPFFGALNFDMWIQLLYKHAWHHLRQFGIEQEAVA